MQYNPIYTYKKLDRQDGGAQGPRDRAPAQSERV